MNKYIERLFDEWKQHGKIIIAVDFDDTISPWKINPQSECNQVIKTLVEAKLTGAYLVIFTACNKDRYEEIRNYCGGKGLAIDGINETPIVLQYGHDKKIYANIFIDDRAGLDEALSILTAAMYKQRAYLESQKQIYL